MSKNNILGPSQITDILEKIGAPGKLVKQYIYAYVIHRLTVILRSILVMAAVTLSIIVSLINIIATKNITGYIELILLYLLLALYMYYSEKTLLDVTEKIFNKTIQINIMLLLSYIVLINKTLMYGVLTGLNAATTLFLAGELTTYIILLLLRDKIIENVKPEKQVIAETLLPK